MYDSAEPLVLSGNEDWACAINIEKKEITTVKNNFVMVINLCRYKFRKINQLRREGQ